MTQQAGTITHFGTVKFEAGAYTRTAGSTNWKVWPIEAFDPPIRAPVGQIEITFEAPIESPYSVVVTAYRDIGVPLMNANYGDVKETGFVVHLWENVADRTLQNGHFSFMVIQ